ncbi:MAG: iron transporter permease, partial [Thermoleophilia bacterium]|nr:iron transporter permease [Thermoleophilia bacterium]
MTARGLTLAAVLVTFVALGCAAAVLLGARSYSPQTAWHAVASHGAFTSADPAAQRQATDHAILVDLRIPRVIGMLLVGALLASAGALLQSLLGTPLADPYILGAAGGAGVGAVGVLLAGSSAVVSASAGAFVGALAATFATLVIARLLGGGLAHLLLAGLCVSSLCGAALGWLLLSGSSERRGAGSALAWLLGGVVPLGWGGSALGACVLALVVAWALAWGP